MQGKQAGRMLAPLVLAAMWLACGWSAAAQADPYRWCMEFSMMGSSNCYFVTLEQCRAAASGNGGTCVPNTFYTGPAEPAPRPAKKKK